MSETVPSLTPAALDAIRDRFTAADGPATAFVLHNHLPTHGELVQIALAAEDVPALLLDVERLRALNRELADRLVRLSTVQGAAEAWALWQSEVADIQEKVTAFSAGWQARNKEM